MSGIGFPTVYVEQYYLPGAEIDIVGDILDLIMAALPGAHLRLHHR